MNTAITPPTELPEIVSYSRSLVDLLAAKGIEFRLFGSCAIWLLCEPARPLLRQLSRYPKDVDGVISRDSITRAIDVIGTLGWQNDEELRAWSENQRLRFVHRTRAHVLDLCVDQLRFAQTLDLRGRLSIHDSCIAPIDLLLSKLQIVELTRTDVVDLAALLISFELGKDDRLHLSKPRLLSVVSSSWTWETAIANTLSKLTAWCKAAEQEPEFKNWKYEIEDKVRELSELARVARHSFRWYIEAAHGILTGKWHEDVERP
jgi:hypothetical protein